MSKQTINNKEKLSIALRENLKLRKNQTINRDKKKIKGKRILKVGFSSLIHDKLENE